MANNFLNLESLGGSKTQETILSLLMANSAGLGAVGSGLSNNANNGTGAGSSGITGGLSMFSNAMGGAGVGGGVGGLGLGSVAGLGGGGIVGVQSSGIGGGTGGLSKQQQFQQQLQQWSGNNGLSGLGGGGISGSGNGGGLGGFGNSGIGSGIGGGIGSGSGGHPQKVHTGRAITNAGNLANNHYGQQQQQQQQTDIFTQALSGSSKLHGGIGSNNDGGDFKSSGIGMRGGGLDNGALKSSYRNGGDAGGSGSGAFSDFGDFMTREPFFNNMHQQSQQQLHQHQQQQQQHLQQQHHNQHQSGSNARHTSSGGSSASTISNAFPTIGTFSVDAVNTNSSTNSTSSLSSNQQHVSMFGSVMNSGRHDQPPDIFSTAALSNSLMMNGVPNNGGSGVGNNSHGHMNGGGNGGHHGSGGGYGNNNSSGGDVNGATRETGIIEKLLHSYGFIQCCERQARLFFHFSQFSGNIEHLKIGDPVEFEMTYDRRTGKPIASHVTKIAPEVVLSEERVTGTVTTELKSDNSTTSTGGETTTGRISYENRGECFFLPYNKDDVEGNVTLCAGDKVSFQIATNQRGNLGACHIRLENPVHPVKYRGVVCTMKESFGFIERADVVKEIFFHFSEAEGTVELRPGDDVEFIIQTRNLDLLQGKEVACNITRLPPGSVVFEDIATTIYKGQVLKPLDRANQQRPNNDPLPGRIRYRAPDHSEVEVPFGDKDQKGEFTLRHGDWVQFLLATDRRDQLQRATSISLLDETFEVSGERREQGVVAALKAEFGFLRCVDRNVRLFFHLTEVLDTTREITVGDEVEFTTIQDPGSSFANNRLSAIRIKHLPPGLVQFETLMENNVEGVVTREAPKSPIKSTERMEGGVITYTTAAGAKMTIMYFLKDCDKAPRVGDQVRFDICQVKRNKEMIAVNIVDMLNAAAMLQHQQQQQQQQLQQQQTNLQSMLLQQTLGQGATAANAVDPTGQLPELANADRCITKPAAGQLLAANTSTGSAGSDGTNGTSNGPVKTYDGFIAVLKETFGFIETLQHDEEVFFHFSNFIDSSPNALELGNEVEYTLSKRNVSNLGNCLPAENVKLLPRGTIVQPKVLPELYTGVVVRPLRCINPDQSQYSGLVQALCEQTGEPLSHHEFGITSLVNKRDLLQKDDCVQFRVDEAGRAADLSAVRKKKRANVNSIKGQFGFLDYEAEKDKKLFFHMSEVQGNAHNLYAGDCVEFSVVMNQRNGKTSACNVVKVIDNSAQRPERMITRLKINSIDDSVPRVIVIRPPKGPDGIGFGAATRMPRLPGLVIE